MTTLSRAYKYRLYPTDAQASQFYQWQRACHEIQRLCILQRRIAWRNRTKLYSGKPSIRPLPTWATQSKELTALRNDDPFLSDVPRDTMEAIVMRVDDAYSDMWQRIKEGQRVTVRWAKTANEIGLQFRGQVKGTSLQPVSRRFALLKIAGAKKIGLVRVRMHRPLPEGTEIKQAHITYATDGWYVSLSCVIPAPMPKETPQKDTNGVDLGCIHEGDKQRVVVVDDGRIYYSPANLKRQAKRLAQLDKMICPRRLRGTAKKADLGSKRTARRRQRIAKLHQRVARQREHTNQYIARRLVDTAQTTVFEQIHWKNLTRRGKGKRKRGLNRSLATASPGRIVRLTHLKATTEQRTIAQVDPRYTSQLCSACGVLGEKKGLSVRHWQCLACGAKHDRDINAARNIRQRFEQDTGRCTPGVRGEDVATVGSDRHSMNREEATASQYEERTTKIGAGCYALINAEAGKESMMVQGKDECFSDKEIV